MSTVTFYKTKMNRSNRAYDGTALDNILSAAPSLAIEVPNGVIPNVPFAIIATGNTAISDILFGYDYLSFEYVGKTFYSFLDSTQFLATSKGNCFIYHTTDVWAMACKYSADTMHFQGSLERAHVNDLINISGNVKPDMSNTSASTEVNYNTLTLQTIRPKMREYSENVYYLYVYIANPRELNVDSGGINKSQNWLPEGINSNGFASEGLLLSYVGEAYTAAGQTGDIAFHALKTRSPAQNSDVVDFTISDLTSSAITAITISKIPPVSGKGTGDTYYFGLAKYQLTSKSIISFAPDYLLDDTDIFQFDTIAPNPSDGLPPYINVFGSIMGTSENYQDEITENDNVNVIKTGNYEEYLLNIPKMLSNIYNPVYIVNNARQTIIKGVYNDKLSQSKLSYTPDLKYLCLILPKDNRYKEEKERYILINNEALFAPDVTNDYWTKLNAEQTGIKAQQTKFAAITNAIFSPAKGAAKGVQTGGAAGATISAVASTVTSIGNAVYDVQAADRLQEVADRQYNCGNTVSFNTTGLYNSLSNKSENILWKVSCEFQYSVIAPQLHRCGYNTFLQIDEVYENHVREAFNYFKGVDVSVSGLQQAWCDEIAAMFNEGVTLWQNDVENYNRTNYQKGIWEE